MTHITSRFAVRIPRLRTRISPARNNSPGPGPDQASSEVSLCQQLLLLSAGASMIVCLCSIFLPIGVFNFENRSRPPGPDETILSRARQDWHTLSPTSFHPCRAASPGGLASRRLKIALRIFFIVANREQPSELTLFKARYETLCFVGLDVGAVCLGGLLGLASDASIEVWLHDAKARLTMIKVMINAADKFIPAWTNFKSTLKVLGPQYSRRSGCPMFFAAHYRNTVAIYLICTTTDAACDVQCIIHRAGQSSW